tara:strand:+ start:922 stop:1308 length:387 start_codon:yes stop_codon:yes gene_type:complete
MREIKFRAWDKSDKKMYFEDFMALSLDGDRYVYNDEVWWTDYAIDTYDRLEDVILMQYTGLKDKNGVEIYEGDIVVHSFSGRIIDKVTFEYGMFYAANKDLYWYAIHNGCEVIGNIWENPELLKEKRD